MVLHKQAPLASCPLDLEAQKMTSPGEGEVLLRISACGVCRTDLQICEGALLARHLPIVPGHQIIGRVVNIGAGVKELQIGQRVGVGWLASTCGICDRCKEGRENLCRKARFTGWDTDGGYSAQAIVRADMTFSIPDCFSDLQAAPLLCGGVIGYRALKRSNIQSGKKLGLFGFGA
jgi:propanol-preferring alcohol dehydrogenase